MIKFTMFVVYDYHMVSLLKIVGQKLRREKKEKRKRKKKKKKDIGVNGIGVVH